MQNLKLGDVYASENQQREQEFRRIKHSYKDQKQKFEDWEFPPGMDSLGELDYFDSHPGAEVVWKRPHELVQEWDKDPNARPYFIGPKGVGRFDITQGGLGDCWYLSGLAQLTTEKELFRVVVPDDNRIGFDDGEYSGAFHFRYWRAGVWTEVVIDDRLPCVKDFQGVSRLIAITVNNNEFWTALAEKAFAKLYGSYKQIEGGLQTEALEDFTGGISILDMWELEDSDDRLETMKDTLRRAHKRKALIGLGSRSPVEDTEGEEEEEEDGEGEETGKENVKSRKGDTNNEDEEEKCNDEGIDHPEPLSPEGIAGGHAYSVTGIEELKDNKGESHFLIRLRNPWGFYEWKGKWSDIDCLLQSEKVDVTFSSFGAIDAEINFLRLLQQKSRVVQRIHESAEWKMNELLNHSYNFLQNVFFSYSPTPSGLDNESWATVPKDLRGRETPGAEILGGGCDEGEFWISLEDVIKLFDQLSICYWSPLAYAGKLAQINHASWDMKMLKGSWSNAEQIDPEVKAELVKFQNVTVNLSRCKDGTDPLFEECDSSECTMVVALIYELYNCSGQDPAMPNIGFRIFKVPEDRGDKSYDVEFFETATEITEEIPISYQMREVNKFFKLEEGSYCVVPFVVIPEASDSGCDVKLPYLLRIFSERKISVD